jgi:phage baseplate assembly protein W
MAIELGSIKVKDLPENDYKVLGISTLSDSNSNGIFSVNFTTLDQAKDNLYNLIMTKKGERAMKPDFGCKIWNIIFDQIIDDEIEQKVEEAILEATDKWLPDINIDQIFIDASDQLKEINSFGVEIAFSLKINPEITDKINLNIKQ